MLVPASQPIDLNDVFHFIPKIREKNVNKSDMSGTPIAVKDFTLDSPLGILGGGQRGPESVDPSPR
jgi:hypothetical protein